ncbi:Kelch motif protein [Chthoniobacter flavus]|nr:Ig-like domain-containing protein [Chthoniobacter flavus]TCO87341.1 Kelch motif protein [Chthoniobacter flavus]
MPDDSDSSLPSADFISHVTRLALVLATLGIFACSAIAGSWTPLTQRAPRTIGLMVLLSDGTVLAQNNNGTAWYRLTPDSQGHYATGTWSTIAAMHDSRLYCATQMLKDGRIFVAGGEYGTGHTTAEVYNPLTNVWTELPSANATFSDANSEILPDGRVIVALVQGTLKQTIIYNPVANTWTAGPTTNGIHNESMWIKQPDDSILFIDRLTTNSERYIPSLNQWITDATVPVSIYDPYGLESGPGFLLPNGKSIFLGATGHTAIYTPSGSTANGSWIAGPDIPNSSGAPDAPGAMMPNGIILCSVSPTPTSGNHFPTPTTFYEYDYVANTFTQVNAPTGTSLSQSAYIGNMLVVPDGTVLYSNDGTQLYDYQPSGTPLVAGQPTISSITQNSDGSFHLVGTQLNGISEGSAYGDDNQNASNYPIVRLTSSGGTVYFARTYNWSRTSVQTGSTAVTTEFTLPTGLPADTYSLNVIANGIPSDPTSFTVAPIVVSMPATVTEGTSVSATVTLPVAPGQDTAVNLSASNSTLLSVPASVTVLAGQTSANFTVTAPEQAGLIGKQAVAISAASSGYQTGLSYIDELDDKSAFLTVSPATSFNPNGLKGGPFSPASATYTLKNTGNFTLSWTAKKTASWMTLSPTSGSLVAGASTTVTVSINTSVANGEAVGSYSDNILFSNTTSGDGNTAIAASLTVNGSPAMVVSGNAVNSTGPGGGPFVPASTTFSIKNTGTAAMLWSATKTASWLTISPTSGTIQPNSSTNVTVSINTAANSLAMGAYNDTITFTNTSNSVGNTTSSALLIVDQTTYTNTIDTDPGWSRQGEWAWGTPTGGGGANGTHDPTSGATGAKVLGVNLSGDYSLTPGGPFYLTAGPFNLTGNAATRLRFARWLNTDVQPNAFATVDISKDGTNWTNVWNNGTSAVTDSSWQTVQYDISSVADNQSTVYVRWGYQIASGALAYSGWNIDDVKILGTTNGIAPTATLQRVLVPLNTATAVTLTGTDTNNPVQPMTFQVTTQPQHGTLSGTAPNLTYTPVNGFVGLDSFTFTCTNEFNLTSAPATVTLDVYANYSTWAASHGVTGALNGPLADFDGDGVLNLFEWAFGMNPAAADDSSISLSGGTIVHRGGLSVVVTGSGVNTQYSVLFGRRDDYLAVGLVYTVQFSNDLQNWVTSNATPTVMADDGEIQAVTVAAPAAQNGKPFGFVRLQITGPN